MGSWGGLRAAVLLVAMGGIAAPELSHRGTAEECWAQQARQALTTLAPAGARVTLMRDPTQSDRDVYDRQLRYLEHAGADLAPNLLRSGAVRARPSTPPPTRLGTYQRDQAAATANKQGLWGACSTFTPGRKSR